MAAILGSDIDKLILGECGTHDQFSGISNCFSLFGLTAAGYLLDSNLEKASKAFCQTSQHLREENELMKRGLRPRKIFEFKLIELLKEYSEIRTIGKYHLQIIASNIRDE